MKEYVTCISDKEFKKAFKPFWKEQYPVFEGTLMFASQGTNIYGMYSGHTVKITKLAGTGIKVSID
jgi:hypothetical protein